MKMRRIRVELQRVLGLQIAFWFGLLPRSDVIFFVENCASFIEIDDVD